MYICICIYIYISLSLFFYVGYKLTGRFGKLLLAHSFPTKPSAGAALFGGDEAGWGMLGWGSSSCKTTIS